MYNEPMTDEGTQPFNIGDTVILPSRFAGDTAVITATVEKMRFGTGGKAVIPQWLVMTSRAGIDGTPKTRWVRACAIQKAE